MNEVTIPDLIKVRCGTCGNEQVIEAGSQALCQNCVNAFLARNVGLMVEVPKVDDHSHPQPPLPYTGATEDMYDPTGQTLPEVPMHERPPGFKPYNPEK